MSEIDFDEWEEKCKKFRSLNKGYLKTFEKYLVKERLSKRTIRKHIANTDTYINEYLLYYDAVSMEDGIADIYEFASFFIRKCAWSSPNNFKETIASLKKFYKCMLEYGKIKPEDYKKFLENIKKYMSIWMKECQKYNDSLYGDSDEDEFW